MTGFMGVIAITEESEVMRKGLKSTVSSILLEEAFVKRGADLNFDSGICVTRIPYSCDPLRFAFEVKLKSEYFESRLISRILFSSRLTFGSAISASVLLGIDDSGRCWSRQRRISSRD